MLDITVNDLAFTHIRIKDVNGEYHDYDILDELKIDEYNLEKELQLQPGKYVYWSSILEQVRSYLESAELQEEHTKANLYEVARNTLIAEGTPKPTKDQIDSWILRQEEFIQTKEQVNTFNNYVKQLNFVVKALEQRHSMLVQLSALKRDQRNYQNAINNI